MFISFIFTLFPAFEGAPWSLPLGCPFQDHATDQLPCMWTCDGLSRIVAYAFLPDFGYHAMAETAVGDACCQLHWVFNEGAKSTGDDGTTVIWGTQRSGPSWSVHVRATLIVDLVDHAGCHPSCAGQHSAGLGQNLCPLAHAFSRCFGLRAFNSLLSNPRRIPACL